MYIKNEGKVKTILPSQLLHNEGVFSKKNLCDGVSTDPEGKQQLGTESRVSLQTLEILPQLSGIQLSVCHYEGTIRIRMSA